MKKFGIWIIIVVVGGTLIFGWMKWKQRADGHRVQMRAVAVQVGNIEQTVDATGEVAPLNRVEIKPPIPGRIETLLVDEGESVKKGQILAWMSSSDRAAIIDAARARGPEELKKWEDAYKPTPIVAPLSGSIILRNVVVGETVDSSTVLYALSDKLIVLAHVDEVDIGKIKVGMKTRINLDAYPGQSIDGRVFNILYEGSNVSNVITYGVKIEPKEVPPFFRSQMTASVNFVSQEKTNVLLVPSSALKDTQGGAKQVLVPGPDGKPSPQIVQVGLDDGEKTEIVSGLKEGDSILMASSRYVPQQADTSSNPLAIGPRRPQTKSQSGSGASTSRSSQGSRGQ